MVIFGNSIKAISARNIRTRGEGEQVLFSVVRETRSARSRAELSAVVVYSFDDFNTVGDTFV